MPPDSRTPWPRQVRRRGSRAWRFSMKRWACGGVPPPRPAERLDRNGSATPPGAHVGGQRRRHRRLLVGDPLDRLMCLRIDRRDGDDPPPQLLRHLKIAVRLLLERIELERAEVRQARELRQQNEVPL